MKKLTEEERCMREAVRQAKKAWKLGEVPIGCVIVYEGKIIGRGYNRRTTDGNVLAHAEIIAIRKACRAMGDWRLEGCTTYVRGSDCPGQDTEGCDRVYESQGRLRRISARSAS